MREVWMRVVALGSIAAAGLLGYAVARLILAAALSAEFAKRSEVASWADPYRGTEPLGFVGALIAAFIVASFVALRASRADREATDAA